jgi:hypothetical protein
MNVWQKRKMSQLQNIYAAPLPQKAAAKVFRGHEASPDPGERSERLTSEADNEAAVEANALPGKCGYG